jgi:hypothetical protein
MFLYTQHIFYFMSYNKIAQKLLHTLDLSGQQAGALLAETNDLMESRHSAEMQRVKLVVWCRWKHCAQTCILLWQVFAQKCGVTIFTLT